MRKPVDSIWVIIYVNTDNLKYLQRDLLKSIKFRSITPYIPTVKVLTKHFKGKEEHKEVPFLLNYGFLRIPIKYASKPEFLKYLKSHISCILGYVKNENTCVVRSKDGFEYQLPLAIASDDEVTQVYTASQNASIFSQEDINNLTIGQSVTLHGYPFDGVLAIILGVNQHKKEVRVSIEIYKSVKEISVSFDNIFYTVYNSSMELPMKEKSLEEIQEANQTTLDTILMKHNYYIEE